MKKFNHDNEEFLKFLDKNGFYIPNKSFSTFESTIDELNLILNMEYPKKRGWVSDNYEPLYNNKVMSIFSDQNYSIIETNSMMRWKNFSDVDTKLCYDANIYSEFLEQILRKSIIKYFLEQHHDNTRRDVIRCTFNELNEIASQSNGPTYVFSHIYVPHPPFIFGPNGEHVTPGIPLNSSKWDDRKAHIDQIKFANKKLKILIDNLLESEEKPIIILQGDTGSLFTGDFSTSSIITIRERLSNLNAIYIPDEKYDLFYDGMTPVNTFRIIENTVFNGDYLLLKDKTYWSTKDTPHNYKDVSNHLLN
jgi:hypothetical protein